MGATTIAFHTQCCVCLCVGHLWRRRDLVTSGGRDMATSGGGVFGHVWIGEVSPPPPPPVAPPYKTSNGLLLRKPHAHYTTTSETLFSTLFSVRNRFGPITMDAAGLGRGAKRHGRSTDTKHDRIPPTPSWSGCTLSRIGQTPAGQSSWTPSKGTPYITNEDRNIGAQRRIEAARNCQRQGWRRL